MMTEIQSVPLTLASLYKISLMQFHIIQLGQNA